MLIDPGQVWKQVETPTSRVYFVGDLVYKVKKNTRNHFIDYSTISQRSLALRREFEKGAKYSPLLYRSVVDVYVPECPEAEPAICMNFLGDHCRTLFSSLQRLPSRIELLRRLLGRVRHFHATTPVYRAGTGPGQVSMSERFRLLLNESRELGVPVSDVFVEGFETFARHYETQYLTRLGNGLIRDLHGDLHTDNILYDGDDFILFDFLDFDVTYVTGDIALDLAFLAMDFVVLEDPRAARRLLRLVDAAFDVDLKVLFPLVAFGLLNRANVLNMHPDSAPLAPAYSQRSEILMEDYLRDLIR